MAKRTYYFAGTYGRIGTERTGTQLKQMDLTAYVCRTITAESSDDLDSQISRLAKELFQTLCSQALKKGVDAPVKNSCFWHMHSLTDVTELDKGGDRNENN
jgi:hypothetical protein